MLFDITKYNPPFVLKLKFNFFPWLTPKTPCHQARHLCTACDYQVSTNNLFTQFSKLLDLALTSRDGQSPLQDGHNSQGCYTTIDKLLPVIAQEIMQLHREGYKFLIARLQIFSVWGVWETFNHEAHKSFTHFG